MAISQTRTIEKKGILIFTPEERASYVLRVYVIVQQTPLRPSRNYKLQPSRCHWGWATLMSNAYVVRDIQLQFENQLIYDCKQDLFQIHLFLNSNLQEIAEDIGELSLENPAPPNILVLPMPPFQPVLPPETHIEFVLEPDVIIEVYTDVVEMFIPEDREYNPLEAPPPEPPGGDKRENPPSTPPPPNAPPSSGLPGSGSQFEISPPYDGIDDGGRTYVPPFRPPWEGDDGQDQSARYTVTVRLTFFQPNGQPDSSTPPRNEIRINIPGKITGLGTNTPNDPNGFYGILSNGQLSAGLGPNYAFKIAWPRPEFTGYAVATIIQVLKQ